MKLFMILGALLLPATVEAYTFMSRSELDVAVDAYDTDPTAAEATYGPIDGWDVSRITDMSLLFKDKANFNADISGWDTSNVTDMSNMFNSAAVFNQPLYFDTSSVTSMRSMFHRAYAFNAPLSLDTSRVSDMHGMFAAFSTFNQPLNLDTSSVTSMASMFQQNAAFNQPLSLDTSSVTSMLGMFNWATGFNQPLSLDTSSVVWMNQMFDHAAAFNQPLSFDTSSVGSMWMMFEGASSLSGANKLLIRCAWASTPAFVSAGYDSDSWASGSCPPPPSPPLSPPPPPKTYRPIQPLWGGQCAIPGVSDGFSSYCCSYTDPTLLTQQDCENKCNADANCVAYSWKISYDHCQVYDATGLPDLDAVVGSRSLSPPQGHWDANCYVVVPPTASVSCAALDDPTTCTKQDSKKVRRRCSPSAKPGWGGVGHKKCAKLCKNTDERLSAKCKQACCVASPPSPSPSPPPPPPPFYLDYFDPVSGEGTLVTAVGNNYYKTAQWSGIANDGTTQSMAQVLAVACLAAPSCVGFHLRLDTGALLYDSVSFSGVWPPETPDAIAAAGGTWAWGSLNWHGSGPPAAHGSVAVGKGWDTWTAFRIKAF